MSACSPDALGFRISNVDPGGRYRITKEIITDPHQNCVLMHTRLEADSEMLAKLRLFALLAPHLESGRHIQLDETAFPIILAWRLHQAQALQDFDPYPMVLNAAGYLICHGPVTPQECWEENGGYSPSTLAVHITALICAAAFARERGEQATAQYFEEYADFLESHVESWTVTTESSLVPGIRRHFIRIRPADAADPQPDEDANHGVLELRNQPPGAPIAYPAKEIVDAGFLELMVLGRPTGGAMPLVWAHSEYIKLVRSATDGQIFDMIPEVADRYRNRRKTPPLEIWKFNRQVRSVPAGGTLRVQANSPFRLRWTCDDWNQAHDAQSAPIGTGHEYADIPVAHEQHAPVRFTFFWTAAGHWEGRDFQVCVSAAGKAGP